MAPKFSRRGWFRGVFSALFACWARPAAGAVAGRSIPVESPGTTFVGGYTTTTVYDAAGSTLRTASPDSVTTYRYDWPGQDG